ncbi:Deoxycytidine monophosphate (dCMP) deaminase, partial [Coemansia aciculifera]
MFISLIGSKASGKEEVANYLVTRLNFTRLYLDKTKDNKHAFATAKDLIDYITPRWRQNFVTTSVTSPIDVYLLWKRPFVLVVAIDAPLGTRYARYCAKSPALPLSLAQFVAMDDTLLYQCEEPPTNILQTLTADSDLEPPQQEQLLLSPIIRNAAAAHELNLKRVLSSANLTIANTFSTLADLHAYLDHLDLLNTERIRPSWDT